MKSVFLCGFMGCGKSTAGRILAKNLGLSFFDLDEYIEKKAEMKISEIFKKYGEEHFRKLESMAISDFKDKTGVIATGGGALLSEQNSELANSFGITVFIDVPFEVCYSRIKGDIRRPIAYNSTKEQLKERFDFRYPLYKSHSLITVSGSGSPGHIAKQIAEAIAGSKRI